MFRTDTGPEPDPSRRRRCGEHSAARSRRRRLRLVEQLRRSSASSARQPAARTSTAAQQVVTQALQRPTSITVTTPVGKTVPDGQEDRVHQLRRRRSASCRADRRAGGQGARLDVVDDLHRRHADQHPGRVSNGDPRRAPTRSSRPPRFVRRSSPQIPQLQSQGHPRSPTAPRPIPVASPFIYNTSTASQNAAIGKYLAAEIVANSKGKANTLYVNLPALHDPGSAGRRRSSRPTSSTARPAAMPRSAWRSRSSRTRRA